MMLEIPQFLRNGEKERRKGRVSKKEESVICIYILE